MPATVRLVETRDLQVFFHEGTSSYLLITWSEMEMAADGVRFWGDRLAEQAGINAIGIMARRPHWFPRDAVEEVMPLIRPYLDRFRERVTYGHSMGGYGALKFGRLFGASRAIAFCPQWSIAPADVGDFDQRYTRYFDPARHRDMAVQAADAAAKVFLFYDPWFEKDRAQIDRLAAVVPGARHVRMPMSGHDTIWLYAGTLRASGMIEAVLRDDVPAAREIGAAHRRGMLLRPHFCALSLARKGRTRWARAVYDTRCGAVPDQRKLMFLQALAEKAEGEQAKAVIAEALFLAGERADLLEWGARLLAARGRWAEAEGLAEKALAAAPLSAELLDLYGAVLMETGRHAEAGRALRDAVRLAPGVASYARRLAHLHCRSADLDGALDWAERAVEIDPADRRSLDLRESIIARLLAEPPQA